MTYHLRIQPSEIKKLTIRQFEDAVAQVKAIRSDIAKQNG